MRLQSFPTKMTSHFVPKKFIAADLFRNSHFGRSVVSPCRQSFWRILLLSHSLWVGSAFPSSQPIILKQSFCWDRECLSANGNFGANHFSGKLFSAFGGLSVILQGDHFSGKRLYTNPECSSRTIDCERTTYSELLLELANLVVDS